MCILLDPYLCVRKDAKRKFTAIKKIDEKMIQRLYGNRFDGWCNNDSVSSSFEVCIVEKYPNI